MDRRRFMLSALAALVAGRASAQVEPTVKGSRDDLRGAKRVFVDTSYDRSLGEAVTAELKTQLPEVELVDDAEGADLVVRCSRGVPDPAARDPFDDPPFAAQSPTVASPTHGPAPLSRRTPRADEPTAPLPADDEEDADEPRRYLVGSVLRHIHGGPAREVIAFRQPIRTKAESTARDFVRKLAKEYHKANTAP